ncbi:MAG: metallophosphoesterase [Phycisphaerae bacterium]|nr:metallophosphoesterase [Phycisphaerae bacterium]
MFNRRSRFGWWACLHVLAALAISLGCASPRPRASATATSQPDYPFKTLSAAWRAARFDPTARGSAFFVATSDIHYPTGADWLPKIIDEVNAIQPRPRFFLISGDLILSASIGPGRRPDAKALAAARAEYQACGRDLARLSPAIPFKCVLGNHDTYPDEADHALFRKVWPGRPVYESVDCAGARFLLLNGGSFGTIDDEQLAWAKRQLAPVPRSQTVIVVVHQPSGGILSERGVGRAVTELLADFTGEAWMICGHAHRNAVSSIRLPHTALIRTIITTGNGTMWGSERPGYWVWCLRDGRVVARIFRRLDRGYRIDRPPIRDNARPLPQPFAGRDDLLWAMIVGLNDKPFRVKTDAIDYGDAWIKMNDLVFRLPLAQAGGKAARLAVLGELDSADPDTPIRVMVSADNATWKELTLPRAEQKIYTFDLPAELLAAKELFVRITGNVKANGLVAGMALCK